MGDGMFSPFTLNVFNNCWVFVSQIQAGIDVIFTRLFFLGVSEGVLGGVGD